MRTTLLLASALLALTACSGENHPSSPPAVGADVAAVSPDPGEKINTELHRHIAELASDAYQGREPGTAGEDKTIAYLVGEFEALGLQPGNHGDWFQEVPITAVKTAHDAVLSLRGENYTADLSFGDEMVVFTQRQVPVAELVESPLVFAGYGINAPERNWNDYADIDVTGKTVVVLINDPGFATQDPALFNGNAMTYYGRWSYKFEQAARQGAAGVIIVHETAPAAYGWDVVRNGGMSAKIGLTAENRKADTVAVESWIPLEQARALFAAAGVDYAQASAAAARPGFKAFPLAGITASVTLNNEVSNKISHNVAALLPGSKYPDEVVIYTAHWDHLGVRPGTEGDNIYNGASDNASGTAALFSLARMFTEQAQRPERSVLFLAVTAEESGLLGSRWYGENPIFALDKTVANFNMDNIAAGQIGPTSEVAVVGFGNSELENYLARAAEKQGRKLVQEPFPEKGFYYRSDHFSLARVGVPALYLTRSTASEEHGREWGEKRLQGYIENHYHKPSDEYDPGWDLRGAVQEVQLLYHMGSELASSRDFPQWTDGVEFKAIRDAIMAAVPDRE
ncbi:M20/M25/M40 family metallo-hydrolase [Seongchinamella unica]|uniref:M20/M25/M40 family metallo-hydrolase n=1 Tax=Seongchinamella unica TaxID=2547392 RepID=A0A4R5LRI7_9GAMM|nr:M28 family metallopeptidase [Seongchinamella unica]TDG13495.1 M20/M25/M40 family metallo-hydrolase [Seongchinamella unica]